MSMLIRRVGNTFNTRRAQFMTRNFSSTIQLRDEQVPGGYVGQNEKVLFSMNWEDIAPIRAAMNIKPGDYVLTIASCGGNAMALLLDDPAEVVAVDWSWPQLHLAKLQHLAIKELSHTEMLGFVGLNKEEYHAKDRVQIYEALKLGLEPTTRQFWDDALDDIKLGLIHCGVIENSFQKFAKNILPTIHDEETVHTFITLGDDIEKQKDFYADVWNTKAWRDRYRDMNNEHMAGQTNLPKADYAALFLRSLEDIITLIPMNQNPYMEYILTGTNSASNLRDYLLPENFEILKKRADRMTWVYGELTEYLSTYPSDKARFNGVCLSNVPDWLTLANFTKCISDAADISSSGARILYWNVRGAPRYWPRGLLGHTIDDEYNVSRAAMDLNRACFWEPLRVASVK